MNKQEYVDNASMGFDEFDKKYMHQEIDLRLIPRGCKAFPLSSEKIESVIIYRHSVKGGKDSWVVYPIYNEWLSELCQCCGLKEVSDTLEKEYMEDIKEVAMLNAATGCA